MSIFRKKNKVGKVCALLMPRMSGKTRLIADLRTSRSNQSRGVSFLDADELLADAIGQSSGVHDSEPGQPHFQKITTALEEANSNFPGFTRVVVTSSVSVVEALKLSQPELLRVFCPTIDLQLQDCVLPAKKSAEENITQGLSSGMGPVWAAEMASNLDKGIASVWQVRDSLLILYGQKVEFYSSWDKLSNMVSDAYFQVAD